ncbi:MAG: L-threonylcarbamoyladenylate synthase [Gammaproteobacteria bacterium]|nr:L-threonylcarbamoyladenylate synthase [Gammaproteobacteria bacterium]
MAWISNWHLKIIKKVLEKSGTIAYPTETLWGIGCRASDYVAAKRLLAIKHRSITKGLIVLAANPEQIAPWLNIEATDYVDQISAYKVPTTTLLPASRYAPIWLTGQYQSIAVRFTQHPLAFKLCEHFGPLISTSANISERHHAISRFQVIQRFRNLIDFIVPGLSGNEIAGTIGASHIVDWQSQKRLR